VSILSTCKKGFRFLPVIDNIVPGDVGTQAMNGGELGFLGGEQKAQMLECYDISGLRVPFLGKFCCCRSCREPHPIWSSEVHISILSDTYLG